METPIHPPTLMEHIENQNNPFADNSEVRPAVRKLYKPWILQIQSLVLLLFVTLALLAMTEYAYHSLPMSNSQGIINEAAGLASVLKRNAENYTSTVTTMVQGSLETIAIIYEPPPCTGVCAPPPEYWLAVGTVTLKSQNTLPPSPSNATDLTYVFTREQYFVGAFLPTLSAVLFSLPWLIIDYKIRSLEPFHQLAKDRGARANTSLCMDYISPFVFVLPFKAFLARHWVPLLTSLLSISTIVLTPLAPEFFSIRMDGTCDSQTIGCAPSWSIFPAAGRAIEALLCLMAFLTILLMIHLCRYSTGVFSEPSSVAGLATLGHNQEVAEDFHNLLGGSKSRPFKLQEKKRYNLGFYTDRDASQKYGLVPVAPPMGIPANMHGKQTYECQGQNQHSQRRGVTFNHPHWKGALGLIILLSSLIVIIVYYNLTYNDDGFERFMDGQGFGVRFVFISVGVIIKLCWGSIFKDISILEPFNNLARRSSKAQNSILMPKHSSPITAFPCAIAGGHILVAFVALSAFLADVLIICLANIHFKTGTTFAAFTVVTWLSCSIMAIMLITLIRVAFRHQPDLPLKPTTIAAVLYYLSSSTIPARVSNLATLDGRVRNRIIRDMDCKYGIWIQGDSHTIDVEPMDS